MLVKNADSLGVTPQRKQLLEVIDAALASIQPEDAIRKNFRLSENTLTILDESYDLNNYDNVYLIGFGKGSAGNAKLMEDILGDWLKEGYVIDLVGQDFKKLQFTQGTHPVVSQQNVDFTQKVITRYGNLTEKDLMLVVVCGGGSAMFEHPHSVSVEQKIAIEKALLKSGANIIEMNKIRQHLSDVKGGGLAQILYPATVATLIFSDVPGNNVTYIASGPTAKDDTTIDDAMTLIEKFHLPEFQRESFIENPKDDKYFEKVHNHIVLSNLTGLAAMKEKAESFGIPVVIYSDKFQGEARDASLELLEKTQRGQLLLAAGETTVTAKGDGKGGRNQEAALSALINLPENTLFCSFDSDGWDNSSTAGALVDSESKRKMSEQNLSAQEYLDNNDSFNFFEKLGDGIITDHLPSNVADLLIVWKWD